MSSITSNISSMNNMMRYGGINSQSMAQRKEDMFNKIDSNGDGGIDQTEFSELAKKLAEQSNSTVASQDVFTSYDTDGDSLLSMDELDNFMKENAPPPPPPPPQFSGAESGQSMEEMQESLFSAIDSSGDGGIDEAEFSEFISKVSGYSATSDDADNSTEGVTSISELQSLFASYDTDGDSLLSMDELDNFMKENAPPPPPQNFAMQYAMSSYNFNMEANNTQSSVINTIT